jgi:hypothetical protein
VYTTSSNEAVLSTDGDLQSIIDGEIGSELKIGFIFRGSVLCEPEDDGGYHERDVSGHVCESVPLILWFQFGDDISEQGATISSSTSSK